MLIHFLARDTTSDCIAWLSVGFIGPLGQQQKAYLPPKHLAVHKTSPRVDCHRAAPQLFQAQDTLYEYYPLHIPNKVDNTQAILLPLLKSNFTSQLITLPDRWIFNNQDLTLNSTDTDYEQIYKQRTLSNPEISDRDGNTLVSHYTQTSICRPSHRTTTVGEDLSSVSTKFFKQN